MQAGVRGVLGLSGMLITAVWIVLAAGLALITLLVVIAGSGFSLAATVAGGMLASFGTAAALMVAGALDNRFRRGRRTGVLLYVGGCLWLVAEWDNPATTSAAVFTLGLVLYAATPAVVIHAALAYPTGRLGGGVTRTVVGAGYLIMVGVLGLCSTLFYSPDTQGCRRCPANLVLIIDSTRITEALIRLGIWSGTVWLVVACGVLVARLITVAGVGLRTIGPVVGGGVLYAVAVGAYYARSLDRGVLGSGPVDGRLWLAQAVALVLLSTAVLAALVRIRLRHRALTRLVVSLGAGAGPGHLRAALAQRLGDPGLAIAYPLGNGQHGDAVARPMDPLPAPGPGVTELHADGTHLATLLHRPGLLGSAVEVEDLIAAVHLALEHERLHTQGLAHLAELRDSGIRIVMAGDEERRRLERDLHDGAQQRLVGMALGLRLLRSRMPVAAGPIDAAQDELRLAIGELRDVARGLHPVVLRDAGLTAALRALAESRPLRIKKAPTDRYTDVIESTVYAFIDRISAAGQVTVDINTKESTLIIDGMLDGDPVPLGEIAARVATLQGSITRFAENGSTTMTLILPLAVEHRQTPTLT